MPWYVRNVHIYKVIDIPRLNDFLQHFILKFPSALENIENRALNKLAEYDYYNPINQKCPKTGRRLNTLLYYFSCVTIPFLFLFSNCFLHFALPGILTPPLFPIL